MNVALRPEHLNILSICTGGAGLDLGVELAIPSARTICMVEREAFSVATLVSAMEQGLLHPAPIWSDARTFDGLEGILRQRLPDARIVHELVMGAREVRADVVAIDVNHIAAVEVKGAYDNVSRLMHQVGMFQLCVPEVWVCCAKEHAEDARLIRHLLPSVGLIVGTNLDRHYHKGDKILPLDLEIEAEPVPRPAVPEMMLEMLWAEELRNACAHLRMPVGATTTRPKCISLILEKATAAEIVAATCAQLRARNAVWRADDPIAADYRAKLLSGLEASRP